MAKKLKSYQTSQGFFDLAIAAPSMKAALDAWGSGQNLFHQGLAQETSDRAIVAATMEKPGVVLKRPVGSNGVFKEHAELPDTLPSAPAKRAKSKPKRSRPPAHKSSAPARAERAEDRTEDREAARAFERMQKQRTSDRKKEEAKSQQARDRRARTIAAARAALASAEKNHEALMRKLEGERASLEKRSQAEELRWAKQEKHLKAKLRLG